MRTRQQDITATIYVDEKEIIIDGNYHAGCKGARGDYGEPMEPDDEPEIYIDAVTDEDGDEFELSDNQRTEAIEALWEALEDQ